MAAKLSRDMTISQFDNGYWYAAELKNFAVEIGIRSASKLRKDELEQAIKHFLKTGNTEPLVKRQLTKRGVKDIEIGLKLDLPIVNYTSNKMTKAFITAEAEKMVPGLKKKSGARYRLNRWREEQITAGKKITYGDLIRQYITLSQFDGSFSQIPSGRYINFVSDFMKNEAEATRADVTKAWEQLKKLDAPKTYTAWKKYSG